MCKELLELQKRLVKLTEEHKKLSEGHCKSGEPQLSISISSDLKWSAEIYSYLMDFHDGGRHHCFEGADTYGELIEMLGEAIKYEEELLRLKLKKVKK